MVDFRLKVSVTVSAIRRTRQSTRQLYVCLTVSLVRIVRFLRYFPPDKIQRSRMTIVASSSAFCK
jgi:hypothetical protein